MRVRRPFRSYRFYYRPEVSLVWQHGDGFRFSGIDYFRYFKIKFTIYNPDKTWVPGICFELIILGVGIYIITHRKK